MVVLEVFQKNIKVTYKSYLLSKATVLVFIFGVITVVLPFIFAYKSRGLWMKRDVFYEQAHIKFKGEYIFTATTNHLNKPISCSSLPFYEQTLGFLDTCSLIKVHESDNNYDGKPDEIDLSLQAKYEEGTLITSIYIIVFLDYSLHSVCPLQMQSAIIFQEFLPIALSNFIVVGDVMITQSSPLICHKKQINNFYNYSIITNKKEINDYTTINIITEYSKRNITTVLKNVYTSFSLQNSQQFNLSLKLRYPEQKIYYKPSFWQILKWAWIQYLSIYIIVSWLVTKLKTYIFNRRLVLFYEHNPVKKKQ